MKIITIVLSGLAALLMSATVSAQELQTEKLPEHVTGVDWIMPDGYLRISEQQPGMLDAIEGTGTKCLVRFEHLPKDAKNQMYYVEVVGAPGMQKSYFLCYVNPDGTHPRVTGKDYKNFVLWICPNC